jgi:hypothetical protein
MEFEIDAGRLWVNAKIRELKEYPIQAFQWEDPSERSAEHILQGSLTLSVLLGAEQLLHKLLRERTRGRRDQPARAVGAPGADQVGAAVSR